MAKFGIPALLLLLLLVVVVLASSFLGCAFNFVDIVDWISPSLFMMVGSELQSLLGAKSKDVLVRLLVFMDGEYSKMIQLVEAIDVNVRRECGANAVTKDALRNSKMEIRFIGY